MMLNNGCCLFLSLLVIINISSIVNCMPPRSPIECSSSSSDCVLKNSYGTWNDRKECHLSTIHYPTSEEELRQSVAHAVKNNLKVKAVSAFSHTIPKLACPQQSSSGSSNITNSTLLISTSRYNTGVRVNSVDLSVEVDSGVGLRQLIDEVEKYGLSLVAAPYWEGVSIGGLISTGAHGSSWWGKGGAVHDHVIGISLVVPAKESEGFAKIVTLRHGDSLFDAAKVSLGMLGVISKVKLSLEKAFKRSVTFNFTNDDDIEKIYTEHGKRHEFGDVTWYPSRKTAVYRYDDRVPSSTDGDGVFDFLGFQSNSVLISRATREAEKALEKAQNVKGKCIMADTFLGYKKLVANGLKNNGRLGLFIRYPVIGPQGKMQSSGSCLYSSKSRFDLSCAWDPRIGGLFFYETTAIFPAKTFGDFIRDVKTLRDLVNPDSFCGVDIYNGLLIRYIKGSSAFLGRAEDSVVLDFNYYRASDGAMPRLNQDVMEEIGQMAFFKYKAAPHWGKNRNLAFLNAQQKYPSFSKFLEAKKQLDPLNVFSSNESDDILFGRGGVKGDGCALEGQCVCSEDRHCSPGKGYFCKPGLVYVEARVCRFSPSSFTSLNV